MKRSASCVISDRATKADRVMPPNGSQRRGVTILMPLAACVIAALIAVSLVQLVRIQRQHLALQERRLQAAWHLESGIQRAVAMRRANRDFVGDEWIPPPAVLLDGSSIRIRSTIEPVKDAPHQVRVECVVSIAAETDKPFVLDGSRTASVEVATQE